MNMETSPLALLNDPALLKTDALINCQWVAGPTRFDLTDHSHGRKLADVADLALGCMFSCLLLWGGYV